MTDHHDEVSQAGQGGRTGGDEPAYGQRVEPEYGARASQYPGWDPYVFGRPDDDGGANRQKGETASQAGRPNPFFSPARGGDAPQANGPGQIRQGGGRPGPGPSPAGQGGGPAGSGQGWQPPLNEADLADPSKNPFYGHYDPFAFVSLFMAIIIPVPLIPAVLGAISIYRIHVLHMKGTGVAVAAVVINVLWTLFLLWMVFTGNTPAMFGDMNLPNVGGDGVSA
ncbi:hypothetical protein [Bifidobacterium favimelis]|uniref:DUF4190 domain-containing protein n=1 Tax=Bifidobacterium favimelis TaxID=3122979 RepID=A0ABU8ZNZ6_9BIFI